MLKEEEVDGDAGDEASVTSEDTAVEGQDAQ